MKHIFLFLKGIAMGAADVVPGVSGGTIAFITDIYSELLYSIKQVNLQALHILVKQGPLAAWQHINGTFLLTLGSGILLSLLSLAKIIHHLLLTHPEMLWAFFFGLILASCWHVGKTIQNWNWQSIAMLLLGTVIAAAISLASPSSIEATPLVVFAAGSIAICAMILPGISGSFLLLLMGLYEPILGAVKNLDLYILFLFAGGALLGLMIFSRLLSWLLHHYQNVMFALLTGFMVGSLVKVWPWKETISTRLNSKGDIVPFIQNNTLPDTSQPHHLLYALILILLGVMLVLFMEKIAGRTNDENTGKR